MWMMCDEEGCDEDFTLYGAGPGTADLIREAKKEGWQFTSILESQYCPAHAKPTP